MKACGSATYTRVGMCVLVPEEEAVGITDHVEILMDDWAVGTIAGVTVRERKVKWSLTPGVDFLVIVRVWVHLSV